MRSTTYKKLVVIFLISLFAFTSVVFYADAAVSVRGYYRKNGTYVQPHYRSNPDSNPYNNWSYPGNTNPYTGKVAPGNPDTYLKNYYGGSSGGSYSLPSAPSYSSPAPIPVSVPSNAYAIGSYWYCSSGYKQVGNGCEKIIAPLNATVYGSAWYCNGGYRQVGNQCERIIVPPNATALGSSWYCNSGYTRNYLLDTCESNSSYGYYGSVYNSGYIGQSNSFSSTPGTMRVKYSVKNYYDSNKTCVGLFDSDFSECISYAYNLDKNWVAY